MKSIREELNTALQNIANNHGVIIKRLSVDWINISDTNAERFLINRIETDAQVIAPIC